MSRSLDTDVTAQIPYYWKSLDWDRLMADYPPPPLFERTTGVLSDDELRSLQEARFLERVAEAWHARFYSQRWKAAGLEPGDITGLDDLSKIPTFTSDDLKQAIEEAPPFGTHHPFGRGEFAQHLPLKIQTSGGTTGMPRTTLFDSVAWEVQGIQTARALWAQGARPGDVVQIPFTNALGNAGWSATVGVLHWLGGVPVTSGSGVVTPTARQVEFARFWGTNVWISFPGGGEYLMHVKQVADELGIDVQKEIPLKFIHAYLGVDPNGTLRNKLEQLWGVPVYDNYGSHEIGIAAFECKHRDGLHVNEDTVLMQVSDVDSGTNLVSGEEGNIIVTSLHRSVPLFIRYNLRDRLTLRNRSLCECGLRTAKISGFLGRSDEMIKLRGTNVYPMACQETVQKDTRTTGEFLVVVINSAENAFAEEMTIRIERANDQVDAASLRADMTRQLHQSLGVRVDVEVVESGTLAEWTQLGGEGKIKRLLDLRRRDR